jgi:hypothetical protein
VQVCSSPSSPAARPRGGGLQSCRTILITCGGMAYNTMKLTAALANLAPVRRHGVSCSCLGAASRVAVWELPILSPSVR